jgi:hypothetical protein
MKSSDAATLRNANRYRLCAPAFFLWIGPDGISHGGEGVTVDISSYGVFVMADNAPPAGVRVEVDIVIPKLEDSSPGMLLCGEGRVLRVERSDDRTGFAAALQFFPEALDESLLADRKVDGAKKPQVSESVQQ